MVTAHDYHFISVSNGYRSRLSLYFGIQWLPLTIITLSRYPMVTAHDYPLAQYPIVTAHDYHFISVFNDYFSQSTLYTWNQIVTAHNQLFILKSSGYPVFANHNQLGFSLYPVVPKCLFFTALFFTVLTQY